MSRAASLRDLMSVADILELLDYCPRTGEFSWRVMRNSYGGCVKPGSLAGTIDKNGYRAIGINGRLYWAHRLAWYVSTGEWAPIQIDHIDANPDNNAITNLRKATMTQQRANQKVRRDSRTGIKGVTATPSGRWVARIRKDGIKYRLGTFDSPEEAHAAYMRAARRLFGDYARAA